MKQAEYDEALLNSHLLINLVCINVYFSLQGTSLHQDTVKFH